MAPDTNPAMAPGTAPDPRRVQIFQVSTLYGAATLAAALDAGQFGPRADARRLLLISHNAEIPETALRLETMTGYERIAARFDSTLDWNETVHPYHPATWAPRPEEAPLWQRVLRTAWDLGTAPVEVIVESIQVNPAKALAAVFAESSVEVYADGLMSYGPTRSDLAQSIAVRIRRVLHLDLVPGLRPMLLSEYGVEPELVPDGAFRAVLAEIAEASRAEEAEGAPEPGRGIRRSRGRSPPSPRRSCSASTSPPSTSSPPRRRRNCTYGCCAERRRPDTARWSSSRTRPRPPATPRSSTRRRSGPAYG